MRKLIFSSTANWIRFALRCLIGARAADALRCGRRFARGFVMGFGESGILTLCFSLASLSSCFVCVHICRDTPTMPKANVYIGYDAVQDQDIFHARLAMWAFWYRPLTAAEHAIVAAEEPLSIAGPQNMAVFPAHEAGTPLLGNNPKTISVVPMSAIRGDSSFTLCLNSVPAGGASPNCFTWFSGQLLQAAVFSMTNPGAGAVSFTWSASFSGTNLPAGTDNAYWLGMFILPPPMNFDRQAPWSQIDNTLSMWKTNIGARPATAPDTWLYNPGAIASAGIIYMNMSASTTTA